MQAGESRSTVDTGGRSVRIAVGLGSNVGDRTANLQLGVEGLVTLQTALECSSVFETQPVYVTDQPPFLNACCIGRTLLLARPLLQALKDIEQQAGRRTDERRYGPRPLDLDLLLYGAAVFADPDLVVPHPRLRERAFVLAPLAELAFDWIVPESTGHGTARVGELARAVGTEGLVRTDILLSPA